jgi:hypothetical protein
MPVVRVANAHFLPENFKQVESKLNESEAILKPAIASLNGFLHFYAAIDPETSYMTNVSIWETVADAKQLDTLAAMRNLAKDFAEIGVNFDRTIINCLGLWEF